MCCKRRINEGEKKKTAIRSGSSSLSHVLVAGYKGSTKLLELVLV